jgi:hypothetical protein
MDTLKRWVGLAVMGLVVASPASGWSQPSAVESRLEKLEERMRDAEARLAKVEAMVNAHSAHGAPAPQDKGQAMPPGGKGMGGMMDDDMMGDPGSPAQGQPAQPSQPGGAPMGGGGGMGGHM